MKSKFFEGKLYENLPDWANFISQDADGSIYVWEKCPIKYRGSYIVGGEDWRCEKIAQHCSTMKCEPILSQDEARAKRQAILQATAGMWKDRDDIPKDGLEYQKMMREEWDRED